jgi:hypothetical protein
LSGEVDGRERSLRQAFIDLHPKGGPALVRHVGVTKGWGDIYFVTVRPWARRSDSSPGLEGAIHAVVNAVLADERHHVEIVWPRWDVV